MPATVKDAAAVRRQLLAAQLLRGEEVMVTQQGAIQLLSDQGISEVAITVPEGKLFLACLFK